MSRFPSSRSHCAATPVPFRWRPLYSYRCSAIFTDFPWSDCNTVCKPSPSVSLSGCESSLSCYNPPFIVPSVPSTCRASARAWSILQGRPFSAPPSTVSYVNGPPPSIFDGIHASVSPARSLAFSPARPSAASSRRFEGILTPIHA